jgi:hypothetical protein
LTEASMPMPWKKTTNAIRKSVLYRTREINEHIWHYKRQWGYNHTNLTGLEK